MVMNRVWPSDKFADERRVFANIGVFQPVDESGRKLGGKNRGRNFQKGDENCFHNEVRLSFCRNGSFGQFFQKLAGQFCNQLVANLRAHFVRLAGGQIIGRAGRFFSINARKKHRFAGCRFDQRPGTRAFDVDLTTG